MTQAVKRMNTKYLGPVCHRSGLGSQLIRKSGFESWITFWA